mmetsp:Transcript_122634/g.318876  ORF Transcript_122634/g.318876 Transcript_122634/m.318876 type:complete len:430 (-) Transcript_122634:154-1443(-)
MGNLGFVAMDNQVVTHQSGVSRLCNSIICAICVAPVLVIVAIFVLGWNEQRAVCEAKAIAQSSDEVVQVKCNSAAAGDGALILFSCPLSKTGLTPLAAKNSDFSDVLSYTGTGLSITAEMYQCVETEHSETKKDKVGGGTTTVTTYTYSKEWRNALVNSDSFQKKSSTSFITNCGVDNPSAWPKGLPENGAQYAPSVEVGAFTIEGEYVRMVPLNTPVLASSTPSGWSLNSTSTYMSDKWVVGGDSHNIGRVRVSFKGTDWSSPMVTVLGENHGGVISRWTASSSWLCSGFSIAKLRTGTVDKDVFFKDLQAESDAITMILRIVGFLVLWFAFSRIGGPLGIAADCVPCIGPALGDSLEAILCCVSCPPACSCALGIIGVMWVVMRPAVGIPLILVFLVTCGASCVIYQRMKNPRSRDFRHDGLATQLA